MPKAYSVWCLQCNEWRQLMETDNPVEAGEYAHNNVVFGNNVQRVEIRDLTGPLETVYAAHWGRN